MRTSDCAMHDRAILQFDRHGFVVQFHQKSNLLESVKNKKGFEVERKRSGAVDDRRRISKNDMSLSSMGQ